MAVQVFDIAWERPTWLAEKNRSDPVSKHRRCSSERPRGIEAKIRDEMSYLIKILYTYRNNIQTARLGAISSISDRRLSDRQMTTKNTKKRKKKTAQLSGMKQYRASKKNATEQ